MALIETSFDGFFRKAAQALQPYLDHVVFIGGCANALYRHHPSANQVVMSPLTTFDLDLAAPNRLPIVASTSVLAALSSAGMRPTPANQRTNKFRTSLGANECNLSFAGKARARRQRQVGEPEAEPSQ